MEQKNYEPPFLKSRAMMADGVSNESILDQIVDSGMSRTHRKARAFTWMAKVPLTCKRAGLTECYLGLPFTHE